MKKIIFEQHEKIISALERNKKLMIFEVNAENKPITALSELKLRNFEITAKNGDIIKPAINYINQYYTKEVHLDMLASLCDISKSYLCKLFNKRYGKGVTRYITELRLEKACMLLEKTENSVVGIALDVGYVDCGYFNKLFKKYVGCTPLEYRNNPHNVYLK